VSAFCLTLSEKFFSYCGLIVLHGIPIFMDFVDSTKS